MPCAVMCDTIAATLHVPITVEKAVPGTTCEAHVGGTIAASARRSKELGNPDAKQTLCLPPLHGSPPGPCTQSLPAQGS